MRPAPPVSWSPTSRPPSRHRRHNPDLDNAGGRFRELSTFLFSFLLSGKTGTHSPEGVPRAEQLPRVEALDAGKAAGLVEANAAAELPTNDQAGAIAGVRT